MRDETFTTAWEHTKAIGNYLHKLNVINPKDTCNWGFNIIEESHKQAVRKVTLKMGEKKTITNVIMDNSITNTGTTDLNLYIGKVVKGTATVMHAGEHVVLTKGSSTITVANPSFVSGGKFEVLVRR